MSKNGQMGEQISQSWSAFWLQRTAQERTLLRWCAVVVLAAMVYFVLLAPALNGRAQLTKTLPDLRLKAAEIQNLAKEAQLYLNQAPPAVKSMTKESLETALTQRGLTVQSVSLTSDFAKVQLAAVSFAGLINWLDEEQKINRIIVLDAAIVAQPVAGMVNATLTLKQRVNE